jgi:hypothetical protein
MPPPANSRKQTWHKNVMEERTQAVPETIGTCLKQHDPNKITDNCKHGNQEFFCVKRRRNNLTLVILLPKGPPQK